MEVIYKKIVNAHDHFIRTAMADERVARDFFSANLPVEVLCLTDLTNLKLQPRSHINDMRKEATVDILYKTTIAGSEAYLYLLLEHQSTPDELMAFRMLKYTCNIMDQHIKTQQKKLLPLVYPMVIYHAERAYPYSTDIKKLIDAPEGVVEKYFLKPFHLIDLGQIEDETLKRHAWAGVMELALKHIFARDIMPYLYDMAEILHHIDRSGGGDYVSVILQYLLERGELKNKQAFFELINVKISPEVGDKVMTLAEQLKEEGRLQGKLEGKTEGIVEIAESLLAEKVELAFIQKITGLSLAKLKEIQKKH
jgi:predicted transposase/invertase (TIGR01784 family)